LPIRKEWIELTPDNIAQVPEKDGVYELGDGDGNIIYIAGTPNLREGIREKMEEDNPCLKEARFFRYEEVFMYTMRESELIQQFIRQHKRLPKCNEEII